MKQKILLYPNEQKLIREKLINILELDEHNSITLYDLENHPTKTKQIICNNLSDMSKEEISKELEECFENDLDGICQFCNMFECECI